MNLAEREEPVAVAAEIDESSCSKRLYPGDLGEIDVALDLLVLGKFEVELLNPVALEHRRPRFLGVAPRGFSMRMDIEFSPGAPVRRD